MNDVIRIMVSLGSPTEPSRLSSNLASASGKPRQGVDFDRLIYPESSDGLRDHAPEGSFLPHQLSR